MLRDGARLQPVLCAAPAASPAANENKSCTTEPLPPTPRRPAEPRADWSPLLDRVRRGQAAVGRERAVPIVVGKLAAWGGWPAVCVL